MYLWLDLEINRWIIGILSLILGVLLCTLNYTSPNMKYRNIA